MEKQVVSDDEIFKYMSLYDGDGKGDYQVPASYYAQMARAKFDHVSAGRINKLAQSYAKKRWGRSKKQSKKPGRPWALQDLFDAFGL